MKVTIIQNDDIEVMIPDVVSIHTVGTHWLVLKRNRPELLVAEIHVPQHAVRRLEVK